MAEYGFHPGNVVPDGKIHRFRDKDERTGRKSAWYIAHRSEKAQAPIAACIFGSWKRGTKYQWRHESIQHDPFWERKFLEDLALAKIERERLQRRVAERQQVVFVKCRIANIDHPYILAKGLNSAPHARQDRMGTLLLPMLDVPTDELVNVQRVFRDGKKLFGKSGRFLGTHLRIGNEPAQGETLYLTEGYATAVSIHEATGRPAICCWSVNNLENVAKLAKIRWPEAKLAIAADNDQWTKEPIDNPGLTIASKVGGQLNVPVYAPRFVDTHSKPTDFNDLARLEGRKQVAIQLKAIPEPAEVFLYANDPMANARRFLADMYMRDDRPMLYTWRGDHYGFSGRHYPLLEDASVRSQVYSFLERAQTIDKSEMPVPFKPKPKDVDALLDALKAITHLPRTSAEPPVWLDGRASPPAREMMSVANGLVHLPSRRIQPHTPELFTNHTLPYTFDPLAPPPARWLAFLKTLWSEEEAEQGFTRQIDTLQEIFGYILSGDMRQQKIFMLIGPTRSGKGTISRILRDLIGAANTASLSLTAMATNFGIQNLIGKPLAIIGDARLSGKSDQAMVMERLLSISGEDSIPIDRKHKDVWQGVLPTRLVILTNDLPNMRDISGALFTRLVIIRMTRSFAGKEDLGLYENLSQELPSILNWSLEGLDRLSKRKYFTMPSSSGDSARAIRHISSPVAAFVEDACVVAADVEIPCYTLYQRYRRWCEVRGVDRVAPEHTFGADLRSVVPGLQTEQRRKSIQRGERQPGENAERIRVYKGIAASKD